MRRVAAMVRKDLLRQFRSPLEMSVVLAFPLVFSLMVALAFGGGGQAPKVNLLIEDLDQALLSELLIGVLGSGPVAEYVEFEAVGSEGRERMERGEASALLRIPERFSEHVIEGTPVTLELVRNPAEGILPEIAEQAFAVLAEVMSAGSHLMREPLDEVVAVAALADSGETEPTAAQVGSIAVATHEAIQGVEDLLLPPAITLESVRLGGADEAAGRVTEFSVFLFVLPGMSVLALFMVGDFGMRDVLTEAEGGTLRRQLSSPVPAYEILLGKVLYTAALAAISLVLLSAIGWLVASHGVSVPGFALLSFSLILGVTGFSSLIYGAVRTRKQGETIAGTVLLACGFLGGSFMPVSQLPPSLRAISPITPFYWATTGYEKLIQHGSGISEILAHSGVLIAFGACTLAVGSWALGRRVRRGVVG